MIFKMRRKIDKNNDKNYFFNREITGVSSGDGDGIDLPIDDEFSYDDEDDGVDNDLEPCYMFNAISAIMAMDKPFGILFDIDKIEKFLISRGYKIVDKYFSHINDSIKVATKDDPDNIPDSTEGARYHIRAVFANEVQDILLKWLLKIGK